MRIYNFWWDNLPVIEKNITFFVSGAILIAHGSVHERSCQVADGAAVCALLAAIALAAACRAAGRGIKVPSDSSLHARLVYSLRQTDQAAFYQINTIHSIA